MQFDLAQSPARFDGWTVRLTQLHGVCGELFDKPTRTMLIDPTAHGPKVAVAHGIAHLVLNHHLEARDWFTAEQCDAADDHARSMLGAAVEWAKAYEPTVT